MTSSGAATHVKLAVSELTRLAFLWAEQDRQGLVEAYPRNSTEPAVVEARNMVNQLRAYRLKRWGRTQHEADMDTAVSVPVSGLRRKGP